MVLEHKDFLDFEGVYLEALGESVTVVRVPPLETKAILTFKEAVTSRYGQQYQYLELMFSEKDAVKQGEEVQARGEIWKITQKLKHTYPTCARFVASNA